MTYLKTWLMFGNKNIWINKAWDPAFSEKSFIECKSIAKLADKILHGNWCLGQAFWYKDICLINQIDGGDEWLVIKQNRAFESFTCDLMGREKFINSIKSIRKATVEQCVSLNYR